MTEPPVATAYAPAGRTERLLEFLRRRVLAPLRAVVTPAIHAWQTSLQLRVAATTLVITGVAVLVIGVFIVEQVTGGVLHAKRDAAVSQAQLGYETASNILSLTDAGSKPEVQNALSQIQSQLTASG